MNMTDSISAAICAPCASALSGVKAAPWIALVFGFLSIHAAFAELPTPTLPSPFVAVDLNIGDSENVTLTNGDKVTVKLIDVKDYRDSLRGAVRRSEVKVEVGRAAGDAWLGDLSFAGHRGQRANRLPSHQGLRRSGQQVDVEHGCLGPGKRCPLAAVASGSAGNRCEDVHVPGAAGVVRDQHADVE